MTNKEKDLIIKALKSYKNDLNYKLMTTTFSSMNIDEKAYYLEEMNNIDILIKDIKANNDDEKIKIFNYLCNNWIFRNYNPKGDYYVISFDIKDKNINDSLDKFLKGERVEMYHNEIRPFKDNGIVKG